MSTSPILIIGKNAKTGSRVNQRLMDLGIPTRAVSRGSSPAFDWNDPTTWRAAMSGAKQAYVTYQPDLAVPQAEKTMKGFLALALELGLEHVVLLSGRGEPGAERAEKILQTSGLSWNVVRASWFFQNFSEGFMVEGILKGELLLPVGDIVEPFIDADDIADVAVAALTQTELRNRLFEVTGPEALTFSQCTEIMSKALGRTVRYQQVPLEAFLGALKKQGLPEDVLWLMNELFTVVLDGRNSKVMNGVEEALGRRATKFETYVARTAASGVWNSPETAALS